MRINRYKEKITGFTINLVMLLVFWGGMLRKSFNADTLAHMASPDADILWNIESGRYLKALGDAILLRFGLRTTTNLSLTLLAAFLLFAAAMLTVQEIFKQWQPRGQWERWGYFLGLNLVFLNVLFAETLMFSEGSIYFGLGYLLAAMGVKKFTEKKYASMVLLLIAASCAYQYTTIFAAVLAAFYVFLECRGELTMEAVKKELLGVLLCVGCGGLNFLSIKGLERMGVIERFNKYAGWGDLGQKLSDFTDSFMSFNRSSLEILPDLWVPLLFTICMVLLVIYSFIGAGEVRKILFLLIILAGNVALLYGIPFIQQDFSFPPRMAFCFYLVQGMLAVAAYALGTGKIRGVISLICAGYLTIQLLFSNIVVTNHFISNTLDEVYVNMMYQEVLKYEEETGTAVTKIAVCKDADAPDHYPEVGYHVHQINERSLGTATTPLIRMTTGRSFEKVDFPEDIYETYFKGQNWDHLDLSQQLIMIGDTAYWCIF